MKKSIITLLAFVAFIFFVQNAHAQAVEGEFELQGKVRPAYIIELNYTDDVVEAALKEHLGGELDTKGSYKKGVRRYMGVNFNKLGGEKLDVYTEVERKSKKEKGMSVVHMWVSKGYDNFISSTNDQAIAFNAIDFLNNFMGKAAAYKLNIDITSQEEIVAKEEKKLSKLVDDEKDNRKKIESLEKEIQSIQANQEKQKTVIEAQKKILADLKGKQ